MSNPVGEYRCGFFSFGQVDIHFSFYFDLVKKGVGLLMDSAYVSKMYQEMATHYIDFVASLPNIAKKHVIAVYPSPVHDFRVPRQLVHYGILTEDEVLSFSKENWLAVVKRDERSKRLALFNDACRQVCASHDIEFISFHDQLLDENHQYVRAEFIDISPYNVHLLWEPLMKIFCDRFDGMGFGVEWKHLENLDASASTYIKDKSSRVVDYHEEVKSPLEPLVDFIRKNIESSPPVSSSCVDTALSTSAVDPEPTISTTLSSSSHDTCPDPDTIDPGDQSSEWQIAHKKKAGKNERLQSNSRSGVTPTSITNNGKSQAFHGSWRSVGVGASGGK
jgi:hypothetical protein